MADPLADGLRDNDRPVSSNPSLDQKPFQTKIFQTSVPVLAGREDLDGDLDAAEGSAPHLPRLAAARARWLLHVSDRFLVGCMGPFIHRFEILSSLSARLLSIPSIAHPVLHFRSPSFAPP